MGDNMKIRKAKKQDVKDIQDLRYLLAKHDKSLGLDIVETEWGYTEVGKKDLEYFLNEQYIYVAEENEKIVGFITAEIFKKKAWYTVQLGSINNIFVLEEYRNQGIGKALMKTAIEALKEAGITNIQLDTYNKNSNSIKFYEGLGFEKCNLQMLYQEDKQK